MTTDTTDKPDQPTLDFAEKAPTSVAVVIAPKDAAKLQDDARQQFQEQIDFFKKKLNLPTERWDDIKHGAHDRAFIVAGAKKADLLNDLRAAVLKANQGASIGEFRKAFAAAVKNSGWTGWTGSGTTAGVAWRTRVIYQTNIATSYAAGRWKQLNDPELLKVRPYWRYIHSDSVLSPRPQHKAWGDAGLTLRHDHPFWKTHFPPNGWNCFPEETLVRCDAKLGLKTWYAGEMVEFSTTQGNRLTVTANHPILTRSGWVCAHKLNQGDELISASGDIDAALVGVIDHKQSPTSAKDMFESLAGQGLRIAPMALNDFHSDALLRKPEIHIAGPDGALVDIAQSARSELIREDGLQLRLHRQSKAPFIAFSPASLLLVKCNPILSQDATDSGLGYPQPQGNLRLTDQRAPVQREYFSLDSSIARVSSNPCSSELALNAPRRSLDIFPTHPLGLRLSAQHDATKFQGTPQSSTTASTLFGELLEANPGTVALDQIREIRKYQWSGHVYDFATTTGLIVAGGIIVSNCHCYVQAVRGPKPGDATEPPEGWDTVQDKTQAPPGIDKGWAYAPGAGADLPLRQLVQDKLITYPPAITRALTVDVNHYINATSNPSVFVQEVLADSQRTDPLWLGFVENYSDVNAVVSADTKGYMVLVPAGAPRHVRDHHGHDGGSQRPATPADYAQVLSVLTDADSLQKGNTERGMERVIAKKTIGSELFHAVFEVRPGKKNKALALVTLIIKL